METHFKMVTFRFKRRMNYGRAPSKHRKKVESDSAKKGKGDSEDKDQTFEKCACRFFIPFFVTGFCDCFCIWLIRKSQ